MTEFDHWVSVVTWALSDLKPGIFKLEGDMPIDNVYPNDPDSPSSLFMLFETTMKNAETVNPKVYERLVWLKAKWQRATHQGKNPNIVKNVFKILIANSDNNAQAWNFLKGSLLSELHNVGEKV